MSKIFIASDHGGMELKDYLKKELGKKEVIDLGPYKLNPSDDYPDYAFKLAKKVVKEKAFGILICRTGVGMCIAANKVKGIRAALAWNEVIARKAREHENANVLCLSAEFISKKQNLGIAKAFLAKKFGKDKSRKERDSRRVKKIEDYERTI